jgi:hypothetical protein
MAGKVEKFVGEFEQLSVILRRWVESYFLKHLGTESLVT